MRRNYDDPVYAEWRKRIFSRDKHKCQMPGCGYKRALNAHHIKRWADAPYLRYDVDNGITLAFLNLMLCGSQPLRSLKSATKK